MSANKIRRNVGPLLIMLCCPPAAMVFWYVNCVLHGSFQALLAECSEKGFFSLIYSIWRPYFFGTKEAWQMIALFGCLQLLFMRILPGKKFAGPISPKGNVPVYKANGVSAYLLTLALFYLCTQVLELFPATLLYDNLGGLVGALNLFSFLLCIFLYVKGRIAPTSNDNGITGNFLFDFYWGTELYPRIMGWDIKMFTNCRFGMMSWGILLLSYAAKQKELYGLSDSMVVCIALQFIYLTKFYMWETGYLRSLDIMHDRAGFYICWGCLVWVPCVYTSPAMYLVHHPNHLGYALSGALFVAGAAAILTNYWADRQRFVFRQTGGNCLIFGKKPEYTLANYTTADGNIKTNLLLASGLWKKARHFHYVPELIGALCWSLPALFVNFLPYFYVCFLAILLFDRATRDDQRCAQKYGDSWTQHCQKVRYRLLPYLY